MVSRCVRSLVVHCGLVLIWVISLGMIFTPPTTANAV